MLVPRGVDNLLVAGRCASMTHEGQSAARASGGCFVMGQAAGTAAAALGSGSFAAVDVPALQQHSWPPTASTSIADRCRADSRGTPPRPSLCYRCRLSQLLAPLSPDD